MPNDLSGPHRFANGKLEAAVPGIRAPSDETNKYFANLHLPPELIMEPEAITLQKVNWFVSASHEDGCEEAAKRRRKRAKNTGRKSRQLTQPNWRTRRILNALRSGPSFLLYHYDSSAIAIALAFAQGTAGAALVLVIKSRPRQSTATSQN